MEDPQLSVSSSLGEYSRLQPAVASTVSGAAAGGDLLFAWLTPIGSKVDKRLKPKSPAVSATTAHPSPFNRARSAFRRTIRAGPGHVSHKLRGEHKRLQPTLELASCNVVY